MLSEFSALAGKNILVVDDSTQINSLLKEVFTDCGAKVTTASTGHSAMLLIQLGSFDLILLDLVMPKPDGWDLLNFMQRIKPQLLNRVILLTGDRYRDTTLRTISKTLMHVVFKPFDVDALRAKACETLNRGNLSAA
ncbi:MAG: response regulator [Phycisphaerae bacterium]|nr:response regulator [Phycisphaerae bacterium]